jgi:hypothetical protein
MEAVSHMRQAGDIELTPEMIRAGMEAYRAWAPDDFAWQYTEEDLVRGVFSAMLRIMDARAKVSGSVG